MAVKPRRRGPRCQVTRMPGVCVSADQRGFPAVSALTDVGSVKTFGPRGNQFLRTEQDAEAPCLAHAHPGKKAHEPRTQSGGFKAISATLGPWDRGLWSLPRHLRCLFFFFSYRFF